MHNSVDHLAYFSGIQSIWSLNSYVAFLTSQFRPSNEYRDICGQDFEVQHFYHIEKCTRIKFSYVLYVSWNFIAEYMHSCICRSIHISMCNIGMLYSKISCYWNIIRLTGTHHYIMLAVLVLPETRFVLSKFNAFAHMQRTIRNIFIFPTSFNTQYVRQHEFLNAQTMDVR